MPRATWVQTNFNAGEWSPITYGRADLARYKAALATCLNYVPTSQGGLTRRPGTKYVANAKSGAAACRLQPFEYSTTQAYVIEFGNQYARFYTNGGQLLNTSAIPFQTATVTFNSTTDRVTWTSHGLSVGQAITFKLASGATMPTGLSSPTVYYVQSVVDANTFTVSATNGGAAINFTSNGSGTITGYMYSVAGDFVTYGGSTYACIANAINIFPSETPVAVFDATNDLVYLITTRLPVGSTISFTLGSGATMPGGLSAGTTYYVVDAYSGFEDYYYISATPNGPYIDITSAGSGTITANVSQNLWYLQPSTALEIPTPYATADLAGLDFVQSADVLYVVHNNYAPRIIARLGAQKWAMTQLTFADGPYLSVNTTSTTLTASSATTNGTATLTASALTGVNNGAGFAPSDVGRSVRISVTNTAVTPNVTTWYVATILQYYSTTTVKIRWSGAGTTTASSIWRLGAWSSALGYPAAVTFHQDRLVFANTTTYPNRVDMSKTGDYLTFSPTEANTTVTDANAISFSLNSAKINAINWLMSDEWGLLIGTSNAEWIASSALSGVALTPTNINVKQSTTYGSIDVRPARIGKSTLFTQRGGRKLRELTYQFIANTFQAKDVTLESEHITKSGVAQIQTALLPFPIAWMTLANGTLIGMLYDKEQEIIGWHRHQPGGYSNAGKTAAPLVESCAVIPSQDGTYDELWLAVQRYINGSTVRTIEVMQPYWTDGTAISDAFFVDCGATYSGSATTTITGLTWLRGETVSVLADGLVHADRTVNASGQITLASAASKVQVGLRYASDGKTMRIEAGGGDGPAQGKLKRIHRIFVRMFQSLGLKVQATDINNLYNEPFETTSLFTGDKRFAWEGTYETEGQVFWRQDDPLPSNVLMIAAQLDTQDGG